MRLQIDSIDVIAFRKIIIYLYLKIPDTFQNTLDSSVSRSV